MNAIGKALWYIESHFGQKLSLDQVASASGLSKFHLSRLFGYATGHSVVGYLRARRLTEAARSLSGGAPDILSTALEAGYNSHEAFTRAFRDQFGVTPEQVRSRRSIENLILVEPIRMSDLAAPELARPRLENRGPLLLAGLCEFRTYSDVAGIPAQWQRFQPFVEAIPHRAGATTYGVCTTAAERDDGFNYTTAVEVKELEGLPDGITGLRIPALRYAIFEHRDHVSTVNATCRAIFGDWLPESGLVHGDGPGLIERYGERFDPRTGLGGLEVWVPVTG